MKKTFALLLFLALSFCAAAQVTLIGNPSDPTVVNHAGKTVVAAMVEIKYANGFTEIHRRLFTGDGDEFTDGRTLQLGAAKHTLHATSPRVSARLLAIIFADGELRGEDTHQFQQDMEKNFASMRQSAAIAAAGDWVGLRAKAESKNGEDSFGINAAAHLIAVHDKGHDIQSPGHFGNLPTKIWKSSVPLVSAPRIPSILAAMLNALRPWISPTVARAQATFCCVGGYHYSSYDCITYPYGMPSPNPCPAPGGSTDWTGALATCPGIPNNYVIGVTTRVGIDDAYYPAVHATGFANSANTRLTSAGYCRDTAFCNYETWSVHLDCSLQNAVVDYDTTNGTCGMEYQIYPYV